VSLRSVSSRLRRVGAVALASALLPVALAASPVAAANHIHLFAGIGECRFSGTNAVAKTKVAIEWKDSEGRLKSKHSVKSNASGAFQTLCESDELLEPGDTVKTTGTNGTKTVTVPDLGIAADRGTDNVSGHAPHLADLTIEADTYDGGFGAPTVHTVNLQADGGGVWGTNFSSADLRGWDDLFVVYTDTGTGGDTYFRHAVVQGVDVTIGLPWITLVGNPGDAVDLSLVDDVTQIGSFAGNLDYFGFRSVQFVNELQNAVRPHVGNTVSSTAYSDIAFDIPAVVATPNATSERVSGNCGTGAVTGYSVTMHNRAYTKAATRFGTTSAAGAFTAKFKTGSPTWNIQTGDKVTVACKLVSGDIVERIYTVG
jgi:hypothetical protein